MPGNEPVSPTPWVKLDTDQATKLVTELQREVGPGHVLAGKGATAVQRCTGCDDVIFRIEGDLFAIVHLTWSGRPEAAPLPRTVVLPSFLALELVADSHEH